MMIVMMFAMIAVTAIAAIVWENAAAQQDDHRCGEDKEQNAFHHEIGWVDD
jgi:hypothetical protein